MDNDFKLFPDSEIAGNYKQSEIQPDIQFSLRFLNKLWIHWWKFSLKYLSHLNLMRPLRLKSKSNMMDVSNIGTENMEKFLVLMSGLYSLVTVIASN